MEEITGILIDLFILFVAAKAAGELFTRLRQPAIVAPWLLVKLYRGHAPEAAEPPPPAEAGLPEL